MYRFADLDFFASRRYYASVGGAARRTTRSLLEEHVAEDDLLRADHGRREGVLTVFTVPRGHCTWIMYW